MEMGRDNERNQNLRLFFSAFKTNRVKKKSTGKTKRENNGLHSLLIKRRGSSRKKR